MAISHRHRHFFPIRCSAVQTKLNDTPNTQYNKNTSQNRLYCTLLFVYAGLEIAVSTS